MPNDGTYDKVDEYSPERCQGITAHGQCRIRRVSGQEYCQAHLSGKHKALAAERIHLLNIANVQFRDRVDSLATHPKIKTLTQEIGVIRLLIEQRINSCQNAQQLMIQSQSISNLIAQINSLVMSAAKLDQQLENTVNKSQLDAYLSQIINILSKHVRFDVLEALSTELEGIKI